LTAAGSGFTGVLACVDSRVVKLITRIGAPPACPLSFADNWNSCGNSWFGWEGGWNNSWGWNRGCNNRCGGFGASNFLGSVTEIPIHAIAGFTHNAI